MVELAQSTNIAPNYHKKSSKNLIIVIKNIIEVYWLFWQISWQKKWIWSKHDFLANLRTNSPKMQFLSQSGLENGFLLCKRYLASFSCGKILCYGFYSHNYLNVGNGNLVIVTLIMELTIEKDCFWGQKSQPIVSIIRWGSSAALAGSKDRWAGPTCKNL